MTIPGPGATEVYQLSEILASSERLLVRGVTLKASQGVLAKGTLLGKITSGGLYGAGGAMLSADYVASDAHLHVDNSQGVVAGDILYVKAAGGEFPVTVTAVPSNNQITITPVASGALSGSRFYIKDGRETAICILADKVDTTLGVQVTEAYYGGCFKAAMLIGLHADVITALNGRLSDGWFIF
jgi:hypothetical protein